MYLEQNCECMDQVCEFEMIEFECWLLSYLTSQCAQVVWTNETTTMWKSWIHNKAKVVDRASKSHPSDQMFIEEKLLTKRVDP